MDILSFSKYSFTQYFLFVDFVLRQAAPGIEPLSELFFAGLSATKKASGESPPGRPKHPEDKFFQVLIKLWIFCPFSNYSEGRLELPSRRLAFNFFGNFHRLVYRVN